MTGAFLLATACLMLPPRVQLADGTCVDGRRDGDVWSFADFGTARISETPFKGGVTYRVESFDVTNVTRFAFARVRPPWNTYVGTLANALSDDVHAAVLRPYDVESDMSATGGVLEVACAVARGVVGRRAGLVQGTRDEAISGLREMSVVAGVPRSPNGGAWSLDADANRGSYLMAAGLSLATVDDWARLCKIGGFSTLHYDWWWRCLGHYEVKTNLFPRGRADLAEAVRRTHALGLRAEMHTLTGCIGFEDAYVRPAASTNLMYDARYTLAAPLDGEVGGVKIVEVPIEGHDFVLDYRSRGNVLRIGTELLQYTGLDRAARTFTGIRRGAFGTTPTAHAAGETVDYVRQRFMGFFAEPDSPLGDEIAAKLGEVYNDCGFDEVYLDGADGIRPAWKRDLMIRKAFAALSAGGRPPLYEDSQWTSHGWWFHSRIGAWDHSSYGVKRHFDRHVDYVIRESRKANFLAPQLGWWFLLGPCGHAGPCTLGRALREDEHEYFIGKVSGHDAAMSVSLGYGQDYNTGPIPLFSEQMIARFGAYERLRLARAWADGLQKRLHEPGSEFRLRQDDDGVWKVAPVAVKKHRVSTPDDAEWTVRLPKPVSAEVRVEALLSAIQTGSVCRVEAGTIPVALSAEAPRGAKLVWEKAFEPVLDCLTNRCLRVRVKGDGSGALLNFQLVNPASIGGAVGEHYLRLDFVGWRDVDFPLKEHDSEFWGDYDWPYPPYRSLKGKAAAYPVYHYPFWFSRVAALKVWLNDVPAGRAVDAAFADVRFAPLGFEPLTEAVVTVNGRSFPVPFALGPEEYAQLADGFWTHYDAGGNPIEKGRGKREGGRAFEDVLVLNGVNSVSFAAKAACRSPRAEVTFFAVGAGEPAVRRDLASAQKKILAYEVEEPYLYDPSRGFDEIRPLKIVAGETVDATVTLTQTNGVKTVRRFPSVTRANRRLPLEIPSVPGGVRIVVEKNLKEKGE